MKVVIQRVSESSVTIGHTVKSAIEEGLLVLFGFEDADNEEDIEWISNKLLNLRIFDDLNGVPNLSIKDRGGELLLVSQFTLQASTGKGNRPSYLKASKPAVALPLYDKLVARMETVLPGKVYTGEFGADMKVQSVNDGPFTLVIDTKNRQ